MRREAFCSILTPFLMNRRKLLRAAAMAPLALAPLHSQAEAPPKNPFLFSLNMSTIMGHKLGFVKELEVASKAGYQHVEIWLNSLQAYLKAGGTVAEARRILKDLNLSVEGAIGFAPWIVNDDTARAKGLDQLKAEMELLAQIGCKRIACPPAGATQGEALDLNRAAERYRAVLELGDQMGVAPTLELWGFSKNLSRLSELMYVALESKHPKAQLLLDVYHLYRGGSGLDAVAWVGKPLVEIFHVNDYPAHIPAEKLADADRVFTGDGVAPLSALLKTLKNPERSVILSLEVFNPTYYQQDALVVARTGLEKMKAAARGI